MMARITQKSCTAADKVAFIYKHFYTLTIKQLNINCHLPNHNDNSIFKFINNITVDQITKNHFPKHQIF